MPDILIDISRLFYFRLTSRRFTGIDRVGLEYLRHYAARARAVLTLGPFSSVLSAPDSARAFRLLQDEDAIGRAAGMRLAAKAYLNWWLRPSVDGCVLLNTSHTGLERTGYASGLRRRGARCVYFVHDLIPITHPQHCRPGERGRHVTRMRTALATGSGLLLPSRHTRETLVRFADEAGLSLPPETVAPLAPALPRLEAGPRPIAEPYFVALGTIEPRKNHALLLEVWREFAARHPGKSEAIPRLVIIGRRGWDGSGIMGALRQHPQLQDCVIELASCDDRQLVTWLRHAQALLFPTFTEGYGLPLAEALALGTPAIASDLPVFREIAGDIPEYAGPLDAARWRELVEAYAGAQSAARAAQLARLAGFTTTTWAQHFETADAFIRQVTGAAPGAA
jgi:glycosyltransferase involved in cell wall biosynthesis